MQDLEATSSYRLAPAHLSFQTKVRRSSALVAARVVSIKASALAPLTHLEAIKMSKVLVKSQKLIIRIGSSSRDCPHSEI